MSEIARAVSLAMGIHHGQVDKNGEPYILHPLRVMTHCGELGEDHACAAVLHDVVEDGDIEVIDLSHAYEFSDAVVDAVDALTRRDGEQYFDFIRRCSRNNIARAVKVCDIQDNLRPSRDVGTSMRVQRYRKALDILHGKEI